MRLVLFLLINTFMMSCDVNLQLTKTKPSTKANPTEEGGEEPSTSTTPPTSTPPTTTNTGSKKLFMGGDCMDPDLARVPKDVSLTLCNGTLKSGTLDLSNLAPENIKNGLTIAGVAGTFTDATPPCTSDGVIGCTTTAQFISANTSAYTEWDIRKGKIVGGKAGKIAFYKDMADLTTFNRTAGTGANSSTSVPDVFDTIDDYNNAAAFPTSAPSNWDYPTGTNWVMDSVSDNGTGGGTASNGICDGGEACVFTDRITGIMWSATITPATDWESAIAHCDSLDYGTYSDWRLPTQREWMQAYINGIWNLKSKATSPLFMLVYGYWSATTRSPLPVNAWTFGPYNGATVDQDKTTPFFTMCVRS